MIYRRSHNFEDGYVGDANLVTEEFYDADDAAMSIDQHNYDIQWLTPDKAMPSKPAVPIPSAENRALTIGHNTSVLLGSTVAWNNAAPATSEAWVFTDPVSVTFLGELRLFIYTHGYYGNSTALQSGGFAVFDVQLEVDGSAAAVGTFSGPSFGAVVAIGWSLSADVLLGPGEHVVRVGAFDRSANDTVYGPTGPGFFYKEFDAVLLNSARVSMIGYRP